MTFIAKILLVFAVGLAIVLPHKAKARKAMPWVVYYSDKASVFELLDYNPLVLDSKYHPDLRPLLEEDRTILGYLSLGEVEKHRDWFDDVQEQGLLMEENPNWPGSFYVDVRSPRWTKRVVEELVPHVLQQGFSGIFIDTLDNPVYLEQKYPKKYKGMTQAAVTLIKAIAYHYPDMPIMLNRAYDILPKVGEHLTHVLGESVYSGYDFKAKKPHIQSKEDYRYQVDILQNAKKEFPHLQVMTLDYWDVDDTEKIKEIYRLQRANGFAPYVSTVELNQIIAEPDK